MNDRISATQKNFAIDSKATHDFGVADRWHRLIGATVTYAQCDFVEPDPDAGYDYKTWAEFLGHAYGFRPSATRAGAGYGASQSFRWFLTSAERDAAVAKYLVGAKRQAIKTSKKTAVA